MTGLPAHTFDDDRADQFRPRASFAKTALLVRIADTQDEVILRAPFGSQTMRGDFYVVAEGTGTYGASRSEFEATHKQVAPNRWIKRESVLAYQATERWRVQTTLGEHLESDGNRHHHHFTRGQTG